ncbi:MAG: hypothetical protein ABIL58_20340 [Pseudomonadota bacterium]
MKQAWKGALWSALVFPGLGQMMLKHTLRGLVVMGAVLIGVIAFVVKATAVAVQALDAPIAAGNSIDMTAVNEAATKAVASADGLIMQGALLWITLCWVLAAVDAFFLGRKQDTNT